MTLKKNLEGFLKEEAMSAPNCEAETSRGDGLKRGGKRSERYSSRIVKMGGAGFGKGGRTVSDATDVAHGYWEGRIDA